MGHIVAQPFTYSDTCTIPVGRHFKCIILYLVFGVLQLLLYPVVRLLETVTYCCRLLFDYLESLRTNLLSLPVPIYDSVEKLKDLEPKACPLPEEPSVEILEESHQDLSQSQILRNLSAIDSQSYHGLNLHRIIKFPEFRDFVVLNTHMEEPYMLNTNPFSLLDCMSMGSRDALRQLTSVPCVTQQEKHFSAFMRKNCPLPCAFNCTLIDPLFGKTLEVDALVCDRVDNTLFISLIELKSSRTGIAKARRQLKERITFLALCADVYKIRVSLSAFAVTPLSVETFYSESDHIAKHLHVLVNEFISLPPYKPFGDQVTALCNNQTNILVAGGPPSTPPHCKKCLESLS